MAFSFSQPRFAESVLWEGPSGLYGALAAGSLISNPASVMCVDPSGRIVLNAIVPPGNIPPTVFELMEYPTYADFPPAASANTGVFYVDLSTGNFYRSGGTQYYLQPRDYYSRAQTDASVAAAVAVETVARTAADSAEAAARAAADTTLQANIAAEAAARAAADSAEAAARAAVQADLAAETTARQGADSTLQTNIAAEAAARAAADGAEAAARAAADSAEAAARAAADIVLQANIDAEAASRAAVQASLTAHAGGANHPYTDAAKSWSAQQTFAGGAVVSTLQTDYLNNAAGTGKLRFNGSDIDALRPLHMGGFGVLTEGGAITTAGGAIATGAGGLSGATIALTGAALAATVTASASIAAPTTFTDAVKSLGGATRMGFAGSAIDAYTDVYLNANSLRLGGGSVTGAVSVAATTLTSTYDNSSNMMCDRMYAMNNQQLVMQTTGTNLEFVDRHLQLNNGRDFVFNAGGSVVGATNVQAGSFLASNGNVVMRTTGADLDFDSRSLRINNAHDIIFNAGGNVVGPGSVFCDVYRAADGTVLAARSAGVWYKESFNMNGNVITMSNGTVVGAYDVATGRISTDVYRDGSNAYMFHRVGSTMVMDRELVCGGFNLNCSYFNNMASTNIVRNGGYTTTATGALQSITYDVVATGGKPAGTYVVSQTWSDGTGLVIGQNGDGASISTPTTASCRVANFTRTAGEIITLNYQYVGPY